MSGSRHQRDGALRAAAVKDGRGVGASQPAAFRACRRVAQTWQNTRLSRSAGEIPRGWSRRRAMGVVCVAIEELKDPARCSSPRCVHGHAKLQHAVLPVYVTDFTICLEDLLFSRIPRYAVANLVELTSQTCGIATNGCLFWRDIHPYSYGSGSDGPAFDRDAGFEKAYANRR